ncbi:MAG: C-GCAxxG-C-C family protein [Calditrichaceae bacterium]|jgi:C_GCAxxG_C_C family probable redox protein
MNKRIKIAREKFENGYNCAQSVFFACLDEEQISKDAALKIATGFGAGIGRMQEVCGAITGAVMAMGLKYGRGINDDNTVTSEVYDKVQKFIADFQAEHGSIICKELLEGCNLRTNSGQAEFRENDYFNTICLKCVETAVKLSIDSKT